MKVSIITVVFNNEKTISDTIKSVLNQTYHDIEYIIVDGKSTDDTLKIIKSYGSKINIVISEKDYGIYDAMNKGVAIASGDVIGFINADDMLYDKHCIKKIINNFNEDIDVVYGDKTYVNRNDKSKLVRYWKAGNFEKKKYKYGWMTPHLSTYIKKKIYDRYGAFDTRFKIAADYELMLRFFYKNNLKIKYIPEIIVKMRVGGISNNSFLNVVTSNYEAYKSWKVNGLKVSPLIMILKPMTKLRQFYNS